MAVYDFDIFMELFNQDVQSIWKNILQRVLTQRKHLSSE